MPSMKVQDAYAVRPISIADGFGSHTREDTFEFRRTLLALRRSITRHLWLIAFTVVVTVGIAIAYIVIWPPIFTADVLLAAESDKDATRNEFYSNWHVFRKNQLTDEVQLFTAPTVLTRVVDRLNLSYDEVYHPFMSHVTYLWTSSTVGKTYRGIKERIWPRPRGPYVPTPEQVARARTIADFRSGVTVEAISDSSVGRLIVRGPTPRVAEVANTLVDVYLEFRVERQRREAENAYEALTVEVARARADLAQAEGRMEQYYTQNSLLLANEKDRLDITRLETLRAAIIDLEASVAMMQRTQAEVDAQLAAEKQEIVSAKVIRINPTVDALTDRLAQMNLQRRTMMIHYRADSPEIRDLDRQITAVREQIAREPGQQIAQTSLVLSDAFEQLRRRKASLEAEIAGQQAGLAVKRDEEARLSALVAAIPQKVKASHEMERDRQLLERRYAVLQDKLAIASVSRAMATIAPATIQVIDRASPPDEQSWPQTKLILAGAVGIGLAVGAGLAALLELMSGRVDRYRIAGDPLGSDLYAVLPGAGSFATHAFPPSAARGRDLTVGEGD